MTPFALHLHTAREALRRGDMAAALAAARLATAQTGPTAQATEAWWVLGTAADALNDIVTAEQAFAEAANHAPRGSATRAQMLVLRGKPLMGDGRAADAVDSTRAAV
eukprot:gene19792-25072_t